MSRSSPPPIGARSGLIEMPSRNNTVHVGYSPTTSPPCAAGLVCGSLATTTRIKFRHQIERAESLKETKGFRLSEDGVACCFMVQATDGNGIPVAMAHAHRARPEPSASSPRHSLRWLCTLAVTTRQAREHCRPVHLQRPAVGHKE